MVRRSPLLKLQGDEGLVSLVRSGNPGAFEAIVDRYQARLLGFCRQMVGSTEDAEDVLQEVFVNAYKALLADEREINLRPWLYRIARNRCLNHLRKPTPDATDTMDSLPEVEAASTHERAHNREEFRQLLNDVNKLPETQRSALLLREMDAMSYEDIAQTMETTVPSVKSLLVRARISLAEGSQARQLTCGEVRLELAEAAEGLRKVSGPVRRHVRDCDECADFRSQVRKDSKALAALVPIGPLLALKGFVASKLGLGGGGAAGAGAAGSGVSAAGSAGAFGAGGAAAAGGAASGIGALGSALGAKAVAGVVTAAVITAGAVEVRNQVVTPDPVPTASSAPSKLRQAAEPVPHQSAIAAATAVAPVTETPAAGEPPVPATEPVPAPIPAATDPAPSTDQTADGSATAPVAPIAPAEEVGATAGDAGASSTTTAVTTTTTDPAATGGDTAVVTIAPGPDAGAGIGTGSTPPAPDAAAALGA